MNLKFRRCRTDIHRSGCWSKNSSTVPLRADNLNLIRGRRRQRIVVVVKWKYRMVIMCQRENQVLLWWQCSSHVRKAVIGSASGGLETRRPRSLSHEILMPYTAFIWHSPIWIDHMAVLMWHSSHVTYFLSATQAPPTLLGTTPTPWNHTHSLEPHPPRVVYCTYDTLTTTQSPSPTSATSISTSFSAAPSTPLNPLLFTVPSPHGTAKARIKELAFKRKESNSEKNAIVEMPTSPITHIQPTTPFRDFPSFPLSQLTSFPQFSLYLAHSAAVATHGFHVGFVGLATYHAVSEMPFELRRVEKEE
ncbi:hypothetical protein BC936DRAFT_138978 [Jimgerdemannia flammicorona]|uniref:Uncharacterized protein n=1 Tax=Jimgerdemannia flammicorona TaxID=994334 RepID=A0A433BBL6_9FUNG|nr:hypothetical protein BC936DRAFT_138978 [Jimgerdemannia flammicorona]